MSKYSNLLAVGFSFIMMITPTSIFADDKIGFCDYVGTVVGGTAASRIIVDLPIEDAKKALIDNIRKTSLNISKYRVDYLMNLIDLVYKEPKSVSAKKLAATARHGCAISAYDILLELERGR